jgi:hypothetical protein
MTKDETIGIRVSSALKRALTDLAFSWLYTDLESWLLNALQLATIAGMGQVNALIELEMDNLSAKLASGLSFRCGQ